ncbi:dual specificity tyrosine-phosphorylation-regulated kinase 4-like isoform X1 [Paramuricea clavata]|uniref:Dual specificity tyrosine-phosphorylation-regulated kinase 4-like isoform X1 n=1 Tax=Paramuricea clavata TaxID=317549 RepID=A0A6S7GT77_PARCT|nr:dual specificity tyrosine-phosphorylation-regulated kinase 4-like isoform X1 [Paramuricea clavata]
MDGEDRENNVNVIHMIEHFYFRNHLCITFELLGLNLYELTKKNNFQGLCMMEVLGLPDTKFLERASRRPYFFDSKGLPRCITNSRGKKRRPNAKDLISAVRSNDQNFIKFLSRCLE